MRRFIPVQDMCWGICDACTVLRRPARGQRQQAGGRAVWPAGAHLRATRTMGHWRVLVQAAREAASSAMSARK